MDVIAFGSSLSLSEVMETVKSDLECHVALYYGKIVENTDFNRQNKNVSLIMNNVAENVCKSIREKWNALENISIIQRINDENIILCVSCSLKKSCVAALNYAVETFSELWQVCMEQETKDILKTVPKQQDVQENDVQNEVTQIPPHMIQVQATTDQINKRIESFIERKREQVNMSNIKDFCIKGEESDMCARVDAVLCRRKDSKSHIQVRRVVNDCGPQMWTLPLKNTTSAQHCEEVPNSLSQDTEEGSSGIYDKQLEDDGTTDKTAFVPLKIKEEVEPINTAGKTPPTKTLPISMNTETTVKVEKAFKIKKRTFSAADIESKLDILKRRVVL